MNGQDLFLKILTAFSTSFMLHIPVEIKVFFFCFATSFKKFKFVINVQGDMPFISANHLQLLKEKLLQFKISTLACPFINIDEAKNSSKVKVTIDQLNYASNFSRILDSNLKINKNVFHHIGVYAYHKKFLLDFISMPPTQRELNEKLEQLRIIDTSKIGISVIKEEILGVDTKEDLDRVNRLI